jgi:hypothetical protein
LHVVAIGRVARASTVKVASGVCVAQ